MRFGGACTLSAAVALCLACTGTELPTDHADVVPTVVSVTPSELTFDSVGASQQLAVTVLDQNGVAINGAPMVWASNSRSVATVSPGGIVTATGPGSAGVTATSGAVSDSVDVVVTIPPPTLAPTESCGSFPDGAIATFADSGFEAGVREALGLGAEADLTCVLIRGLSDLRLEGAGIQNTVGAQNLSGLTTLRLNSNLISDVSSLRDLRNLTELWLQDNLIEEVASLGGLTALNRLWVGQNLITDVSALGGLAGLKDLDISNNSVSSIQPLATLTALTELRVAGNPVSDLTPLTAMADLSVLYAFQAALVDLTPLASLTTLTDLRLWGNAITDIGPLVALTALTRLSLDDNAITDVDALSGLTSLATLSLDDNPALASVDGLLANPGLGDSDSDFVSLRGTAVRCADVGALRRNGVSVTSDCPQITFRSDRDGPESIYTMRSDGAEVTRLTTNLSGDQYPAWSPDGGLIAFTRYGDNGVYVMDADGGNARRVGDCDLNCQHPSWSPDGTRLAFSSDFQTPNLHHIYVINADGSGLQNLTDTMAAYHPSWSPDGSKVTFHSTAGAETNDIFVMNADGSGVTALTSDGADDRSPAWSPDGSRIAFVSDRDGQSEIYVMNADGTEQRNYSFSPEPEQEPAWSPDGRSIIFAKFVNGTNFEIFVMDLDEFDQQTGNFALTRLTNHPGEDRQPSWGPG